MIAAPILRDNARFSPDMPASMFFLKKLLSSLILPPVSPLLLCILGLITLRRRPALGYTLAWSGVILSLLLSTPASVRVLLEGLESDPPISAAALSQAQAIVILGGGIRIHAPEFDGATVNRTSLERVRYGARLARQSGLPVLVTGGAPQEGIAEGTVMKRALEEEFRVPVRWCEVQSLDTTENASYSAPTLRAAGVRRVALVTHAAHMRRAKEAFEHEGIQVIPAPTAFFTGPPTHTPFLAELPNVNSMYAGWYGLYEWVGLLARRLSP